jgi:hypothetical protein
MSKATAFATPSRRATHAAAATPAAGPDIAIASGRAFAISADIIPPAECRRWSGTPCPSRVTSSPT